MLEFTLGHLEILDLQRYFRLFKIIRVEKLLAIENLVLNCVLDLLPIIFNIGTELECHDSFSL